METESKRRTRPDLAARNRGAGGPYEDAEWCRSRYESGMTYREIADEAGCSLRTVARWFKLHGIEVPPAAVKRLQRGNGPKPRLEPSLCACGAPKTRVAASCLACRDFTGDRNPRYRGSAVGVNAAHLRIARLYGKATEHVCGLCGEQAAHWAYDHLDPDEKPSEDGPYSVKPEHYMSLCVRCHKQFDLDFLRRSRT